MAELDPSPRTSPLTQSVTRDGRTIQIDVHDNGEGGWMLEVVDEYGNSTVWDDFVGRSREPEDRSQRDMPLRERQKIQEVLRCERCAGHFALRSTE